MITRTNIGVGLGVVGLGVGAAVYSKPTMLSSLYEKGAQYTPESVSKIYNAILESGFVASIGKSGRKFYADKSPRVSEMKASIRPAFESAVDKFGNLVKKAGPGLVAVAAVVALYAAVRLVRKVREVRAEMGDGQAKITAYQAELARLSGLIVKTKNELVEYHEGAEISINTVKEHLKIARDRANEDFNREYEILQIGLNVAQNNLAECSSTFIRLNAQVQSSQGKNNELEAALRANTAELAELQASKGACEQRIEELREQTRLEDGKYIATSHALTSLRAEFDRVTTQKQGVDGEIQVRTAKLEELRHQVGGVGVEMDELKQDLLRLKGELETSNAKKVELERAIERQDATLEEKIGNNNAFEAGALLALNLKLAELNDTIVQQQQNVRDTQDHIDGQQRWIAEKQATMHQLTGDIEQEYEKHNELVGRTQDLEQAINAKVMAKNFHDADVERLLCSIQGLVAQEQELNASLAELKARLPEKQKEHVDLANERATLEASILPVRADIARLKKAKAEHKQNIKKAQDTLQKLELEAVQLRTENAKKEILNDLVGELFLNAEADQQPQAQAQALDQADNQIEAQVPVPVVAVVEVEDEKHD